MEIPGKLTFKLLTNDDIPMIEDFCRECSLLGYKNNESLESMKFNFATFFAALDNEKIISLAGVHPLPEVNKNAWRCLFRGAQLPGYTPQWSMNIFKSGIQFSQLLYRQIQYVKKINDKSEFYISTNLNSNTGAKSHRMNSVIMPRISKLGVWSLHTENMMLYHVPQNLWKLDVSKYLHLRNQFLE